MSPFSAGNAFVAGRQGGYAIAPAANCKFSIIIIFYYSLFFCWKFCFRRRRFCHTRKADSGCRFLRRRVGRGTQQLCQRLPRQPDGGGQHVQPRAAPHGAGAGRRGRRLPRQQGGRLQSHEPGSADGLHWLRSKRCSPCLPVGSLTNSRYTGTHWTEKKLLLMLICLIDCLCLFLFVVFFMVLVGYFSRPKSKF